ncbi:MAG: prenyltransferase, partial [Isosphaeraceae bacterium]
VAWLRSCQQPGGGFTYQPDPPFGGVDDLAYTWAAVRALHLLKAEPKDRAGCVGYLNSLWNSDGGAGDRPTWASNPLATYRALDALDQLGEPVPEPRSAPKNRPKALPTGLRVWSAQIEAHGEGSPAEAVALAKNLRIHLWGAKNAKKEWLSRARKIADQAKVPVRFFVSNEEYGSWVNVPGLGTYSHMSDVIAPPEVDFGPSLADQGAVSWPEYRDRRLDPLQKAGGRLIWQFGENEELVRILLDDSIERGGFAAISTFHFGNPDFTITEPFLNRYRHHLPFVALQDAHGPEPWWFADMTTGFRTLFLAAEPTWDAWLEALRLNRVVAVRHDAVSGFQTWMHGGSRELLDLIHHHEADWKWWDNPQIQRPLVSVVAVTPGDAFEAARPELGVSIRVRTAWNNTPQGLAKTPITELVRLLVDGVAVTPKLVAKPRGRGPLFEDHYHVHHLPNPTPGNHKAEAIVRVVATGAEQTASIMFAT